MSAPLALITGASRGLGRFLAERFWKEGFCICAVARDEGALGRLRDAMGDRDGQRFNAIPADLGDSSSLCDLIRRALGEYKTLEVLINNAAIQGPIGPLGSEDFSEWKKTVEIDLFAPAYLIRGLLPLLEAAGTSTIVNLSGGGATGPRPNFSAYASAKAALVRLGETLAHELKFKGISVNAIAPGAMKTDMLKEVIARGPALAGEREVPAAERVLESDGASMQRVADLAIFLASPQGRQITGKLISAAWDNWEIWPAHAQSLCESDAYTLRRITGRDRGLEWGDK